MKMRRKAILFILSLFLVLAISAIFISYFSGNVTAFSAQDQIDKTFECLNVSDAVLVSTNSPDSTASSEILQYHSETAKMNYYFTASSGVLTEIWHDAYFAGKIEILRSDDSPALSSEILNQLILDYAEGCITNHQFGELVITKCNDAGSRFYDFTVTEFYEGILTGTKIEINTIDDGQITLADVTIGSIFTKDESGRIVPVDDRPLIGEETAIESALAAFAEDLPNDSASILSDQINAEPRVFKEGTTLGYFVTIRYEDSSGRNCTYRASINAYTGEVISTSHR